MVVSKYYITKSFDKTTGHIRHTIIKDGKTVYDMTFKLAPNSNIPFSPIDFLEASLNGEQTILVPQYYRELQNIAFELHLLNACKSNDEKREISFANKIKGLINRIISLFT